MENGKRQTVCPAQTRPAPLCVSPAVRVSVGRPRAGPLSAPADQVGAGDSGPLRASLGLWGSGKVEDTNAPSIKIRGLGESSRCKTIQCVDWVLEMSSLGFWGGECRGSIIF